MLDVPVAFVIFNRPDATARSFARIRQSQPRQLFVISDAPRADRPGEAELVQQTREIVNKVDWECEVQKIYAQSNMGCGVRISSGISEAFQQCERLIILEDDCVADPSFFGFCDTLLDRYADDTRIMAISGDNFQKGVRRTESSYYFSKYMHCWGWATWRRAWEHFALVPDSWPTFRDSGGLSTWCDHQHEVEYWTEIYDRCYAGRGSSWAYPWQLACWMNHGLTVLPDVNLVSNIGFGLDATHTHDGESDASLPTQSIGPIQHPQNVHRNHLADEFTDQLLFSRPSVGNTIKRWRRKIGLTRRVA